MLPRFAVAATMLLIACRIESSAPHGAPAQNCDAAPAGELWIYTSAFPELVDELGTLAKQRLPNVSIRWFKAGTEKIASRIEGELAAGGTRADILLASDPFLYERYKRDGLLLRYASPNELRIPSSLLDLDGNYTTVRISTMGLAFPASLADSAPKSFAELTGPKWKNKVAIGDPITSGTVFTWAAIEFRAHGAAYFQALRANGAVVAGGNAAVQSRIESGEVQVGVLLLENVIAARKKGSDLSFRYPTDGAVTIPGYAAIFKSTRNQTAAKAFYDLLLSVEGQNLVVRSGLMHFPDPRHPGPDDEPPTEWLLEHSVPWSAELVHWGTDNADGIKKAFAEAFSR